MRCLECDQIIENDAYKCEYCKSVFSEEDVETMLNIMQKEKKMRVRKNICLTLLFSVLAALVLMVGAYYMSKMAAEKYAKALQKYYSTVKLYLDETDDIESYSFTSDSVNIILDYPSWDLLSEEEKYAYGSRMQLQISDMRTDSGLTDYQYVIFQITLDDGQMVFYSDKNGNMQTFEYQEYIEEEE